MKECSQRVQIKLFYYQMNHVQQNVLIYLYRLYLYHILKQKHLQQILKLEY